MADGHRDSTSPGGSGWLRDRSSRTGLIRAVGLVLVLGLVAGAVAVRIGGHDNPAPPTLFDPPDTAARETDSVPSDTPGSAGNGFGNFVDRAMAPEGPVPDLAIWDDRGAAGDTASEPIYVPPTPPEGWADAAEPSPLTRAAAPDSLGVPKPEAVRGIYVGSWSIGSRRRRAVLLDLADATEINAFVIDVKDATGEVSYETEVPLAVQVEADRQIRIGDIRALLDTLRAHGIYAIARVVAFKDPLLAVARPEWSVRSRSGEPWEDDNGVRWVDSFNRQIWDYNIELAREAVALGFGEIQWDYVRFPDVPRDYAVDAVYPARDGRTKTEAIREFLAYAAERLEGSGVPMTADVFGITTSSQRDVGIGQSWEQMSDRVDVLLPMVYPSHYPAGSWGFPNPNAAPYQIVKRALDDAVERSLLIDGAADVRPWLQAFSLGEPDYGPMHIRAQIDATYDAGLDEWILWDPAVRYPQEVFIDANGIAPWFVGMGEALYEPDVEAVTDSPDTAGVVDEGGDEAGTGEDADTTGSGGAGGSGGSGGG